MLLTYIYNLNKIALSIKYEVVLLSYLPLKCLQINRVNFMLRAFIRYKLRAFIKHKAKGSYQTLSRKLYSQNRLTGKNINS